MKIKIIRVAALVLSVCTFASLSASAPSAKQPAPAKSAPPAAPARPPAPKPVFEQVPFFAAALSQFLSDTRSFTAGAEVQLPAEPGETPESLPFGVAMHEGRMRWELNLAQAHVASLPKESVAALTQMGLDRIFVIFQPEKTMIVAFPGLPGYIELPMPKPAGVPDVAIAKIGRLERKPLGREIVDGQPTEKFQVTVRGAQGAKEEATVWEATNLQNLPIKLRVNFENATYGILFRNVKLGQPDARYFEPPAGLTKHASLAALMNAALAKSLAKEGLPGFK